MKSAQCARPVADQLQTDTRRHFLTPSMPSMLANPDIGVTQNRAPPRRLTRDALSLHSRRANRESPRRMRLP